MATIQQTFTDIADAIRQKSESEDKYKPEEMPAAIKAIPSAGSPLQGLTDYSYYFYDSSRSDLLGDVTLENTSAATNTYMMFSRTTVNVPIKVNTSNVKNASRMFTGCSINISNLSDVITDLHSATNVYEFMSEIKGLSGGQHMIADLSSIQGTNLTTPYKLERFFSNITNYDTLDVTMPDITTNLFRSGFVSNSSFKDIKVKFTSSETISGNYLFSSARNLETYTIENGIFNNASYLFQNCSKLHSANIELHISGWNISPLSNCFATTPSLTDVNLKITFGGEASYIYSTCAFERAFASAPVTINGFHQSAFNGSSYGFAQQCYATELIFVDGDLDFSHSTNNNSIFYNCTNLKRISIPIALGSVTNDNAFTNCNNLEDIQFYDKSTFNNISFAQSSKLSDASIQSIIDGLAEVTSTKTLTLHATVKAKLTEEQIAEANTKGWTIA